MIRLPEFVYTTSLGQEFLLFHPADRALLNNRQFGRDDWRSEVNLQLDNHTLIPMLVEAIYQPKGFYQLFLEYKSFQEKNDKTLHQIPPRCILNRMPYIRLHVKLPKSRDYPSIFEARVDEKKLDCGLIWFHLFSPEIPMPLTSEGLLMQTRGLFYE